MRRISRRIWKRAWRWIAKSPREFRIVQEATRRAWTSHLRTMGEAVAYMIKAGGGRRRDGQGRLVFPKQRASRRATRTWPR